MSLRFSGDSSKADRNCESVPKRAQLAHYHLSQAFLFDTKCQSIASVCSHFNNPMICIYSAIDNYKCANKHANKSIPLNR